MGHVTALRLFLILALAMVGSAVADAHDGSAHPPGLSEAAQLSNLSSASGTGTLAGWLHVLYGDAPPGWTPGGTSGYVLLDDQGGATELLVPEDVLHAAGGRRALNGRHVSVIGQSLIPSPGMGGPMPLLGVQALQPTERQTLGALAEQRAVAGPQPWVTVLCRFADEPAVTPRTKSWFESLLLGSATAPGLDHYWREVSYGNVNLAGSVVAGWYTLPQPRSYYVYGSPLQLNLQRAVNDCTGVADADVYFPGFVGINLAFNDDLDCCAWGGSWNLTRDGQTRTYRMTWLPPWGYENQGPVAHEMGHGFGLPHSSGPYSATYDSAWDVMSGIWLDCPPYDPSYGCVGTHTISYHKDILGWIPAAQRYVAAAGTSQTITLERLGQPTTGNYLMAKIPIAGSATNFYTVEVRRFAGYDATLPGEAVVIHKVDTTRSDRDAQVVDRDGNGDPSDAGSMWLPGATFLDSPNGISVSVVGQTATGFQVTVVRGAGSTYTMSVTVSGTGTVTSSPAGITCSAATCTASFPAATSVTLTPGGGTLSAWSGACSGSSGCTVSMTANQSVTATFAAQTFALTVSPAPANGTITGLGIGCPGDCSESVASGTSVVLTASPAAGYQLGVWSGCQSVNDTLCTVQMSQARTVAVTFSRIFYTLAVSPVPTNGKVTASGISCGTSTTGDCVQSVASGTSVVLTASPATGYQLGAWSGCQSVSGTKCTVQMTQADTVAVTFSRILYALTISPIPTQGMITGPGISCGMGTPGDCNEPVASGTSVVLTASPAAGYRFGVWSGCQSVSGAQCTVKMTKAHAVSATFASMTASGYDAAYQSVPFTIAAGAAFTAPVAVTNTGSLYWDLVGYRLGYRWYQGSTQVSKDKSNSLPASVAPGASVTVLARVVAPSTPGSYTIRWDMVQLGTTNTWFASQGVTTGDFAVTVR